MAIIGPSVIALGGSIGSGEWLIGPAVFVKWGLGLLWITTVSATLQTFLNLEMARYTLYTGEPITVGFMRLAPGPRFWSIFMSVVGILERGLPGWALASATALAAIHLGRIPGAGDKGTVIVFGYIVFLLCVGLTSVGRAVERTLEIANWFMCGVILLTLLILDILFVPASTWAEGLAGFFRFGYIPRGVDLLMLGALAGYSAYGGFGNNAITNWYRDKGFGMGKIVGYIPAAVGGKMVKVSPVGAVAAPTSENLSRWKQWLSVLSIDQWAIFWLGGMLGMFFPSLLAAGLIPRGTSLPQWGVAAYQGETFSKLMGSAGWVLALLIGFWVLFSTALSNVDLVCRQVTDMLWWGSDRVRKWAKEDIRRVYYALLIVFVIWGTMYMRITVPLVLLAISANIANLTMTLSAILTIYLNRKFLPKEFRPPLWREVMLVANALFFGLFFTVFILSQFFGLKF